MKGLGHFLVLALLLCFTACGGPAQDRLAAGRSEGPVETVQAALPGLPPAQSFNPTRIAAAFETQRLGSEADQTGPAVSLGAGFAEFDPLASQLAWAIYRFDGVPSDLVTGLDFSLGSVSSGSRAWFALSDYNNQHWSFIDPQSTSGSVALNFAPGQLTSPSGQIYVAVLCYDLDNFRLLDLSLSFANRQSVSGQVLDQNGAPIAGALITTTLDEDGVLSDGAGNFTLPAIPDGTWHLMAAKDSFVFFANPLEVTVAGAPVSGIEFLGINNRSHFNSFQGPEPNNDSAQCAPWLVDSVHADSLSVTDDDLDFFSVQILAPGEYYIKAKFQASVLFPSLAVSHPGGSNEKFSTFGQFGTLYVPLIVSEPGEYIVITGLSGGGGTYTLELGLSPLRLIGGRIQDEELLPGAYVGYFRVNVNDGLEQTNILVPEGSEGWRAWFPPNIYVVTPSDPEYSFNPTTQNANTAAGNQLDVDFGVTSVGFMDQGEANNNELTATLVPLPWTEAAGNLSLGGNDPVDYYRVQPTAGKYLRVLVSLPDNSVVSSRGGFGVSIYDSNQLEKFTELLHPGMLELRSPQPCDGNDYFVVFDTSELRRFGYGFSFEEFDGHQLSIAVSLDGQPLSGARVDLYSPTHGWLLQHRLSVEDDGLAELACGLMAGEEVDVELFRFGTDIHRQTRRAMMADADVLLTFDASSAASQDQLEPNSETAPQLLSLPADFSATIDQNSDRRDYYALDLADNQPLRLSWDTGATPFWLNFEVFDSNSDYLLDTGGPTGSAVFVPDAAGTVLSVSTRSAGAYNLQVEPVEAYVVNGTVLDGMAQPIEGAGIYVPEAGISAFTAADGSYLLGPLEPGAYSLVCYSPNFVAAPAVPLAINIVDSSLTQDFTLSYSNNDGGEPAVDDDSSLQARLLADGEQFSANLDSDNSVDPPDFEDWYKFDAAAPGFLSIDAVLTQPWFSEGIFVTVFDPIGIEMGYFEADSDGQLPATISLPEAGTYFFRVSGADGDYGFTVDFPAS